MNEKIVSILYKRIKGTILSYEEELHLEGWMAESPPNRQLYDELMNPSKLRSEIQSMLRYNSKGLWKKISRGLPSKEGRADHFYKKLLSFVSGTGIRLIDKKRYKW